MKNLAWPNITPPYVLRGRWSRFSKRVKQPRLLRFIATTKLPKAIVDSFNKPVQKQIGGNKNFNLKIYGY